MTKLGKFYSSIGGGETGDGGPAIRRFLRVLEPGAQCFGCVSLFPACPFFLALSRSLAPCTT